MYSCKSSYYKYIFCETRFHLVTYRSGYSCTQVDYILTRRNDLKQVQNVIVIGDEECVTHQKLLICLINLRTQIRKQHKPPPKTRIWKLRKPEINENTKKLSRRALIHQLSYLIQIQKQMLNKFGQKLNLP